MEQQVVLVLNNCSAHTQVDELRSNDKKFAHGILESIKRFYRKSTLRDFMSRTGVDVVTKTERLT